MSGSTEPASYVYCPPSQRVDEEQCRALLDRVGAGLWISAPAGDVPSATLLPTMWEGDRLIAHASSHNLQFSGLDGATPCRVVIQGSDAYISPRWYPSIQSPAHGGCARGRAEGRAVGTWDYEQVQVAGVLHTYTDQDRLRGEVTRLAHSHDDLRLTQGCPADAHRDPWRTDELPEDFFDAMLCGIIGLELEITEVVGRFKLAQNRTETDRAGIVEGLTQRGRAVDLALGEAISTATPLYRPDPSDTTD